jgi:hypothetical protein
VSPPNGNGKDLKPAHLRDVVDRADAGLGPDIDIVLRAGW